MASAEQIKALIKSHLNGDDSHFYSIAMQVAAHEAKLGHGPNSETLFLKVEKRVVSFFDIDFCLF